MLHKFYRYKYIYKKTKLNQAYYTRVYIRNQAIVIHFKIVDTGKYYF